MPKRRKKQPRIGYQIPAPNRLFSGCLSVVGWVLGLIIFYYAAPFALSIIHHLTAPFK